MSYPNSAPLQNVDDFLLAAANTTTCLRDTNDLLYCSRHWDSVAPGIKLSSDKQKSSIWDMSLSNVGKLPVLLGGSHPLDPCSTNPTTGKHVAGDITGYCSRILQGLDSWVC